MVTVSPPVSPKVVARILMIQKVSVTAGTLLITARASFAVMSFPRMVVYLVSRNSKAALPGTFL